MDVRDIAYDIITSLMVKFPEMKIEEEKFGREYHVIDFMIGPDSGTISINIEPEELVCINCSGILSDSSNLVPVTDGEVFDVACIHNLPRLRNWKELSAEERKEFDKGSVSLFELLQKLADKKEVNNESR